jgi:aspartyl-tRNA(Asn)/glutamyl-tRNA(Gln) amidotransferase subunit A
VSADDLGFLGIAALAPRLARLELSPVELCRALLARCDRLEPRLNAFITLEPERILADAAAAERELAAGRPRGPLHGIPVAVKDLCWTRGERTTGGAKIYSDFIPDADASVVARLRAAGAIVFGKTGTPEFAYGPLDAYHFGVTRNPWDLARFPGGSSMGAAAALAAGLVPAALGSDTGGSIRHPAHWSGVTGLKPTYGRVPLAGVIALATSLDHVGPMTRSAEDAALLLAAIAGHDPADPTSVDAPVADYAAELARPIRGLRVGVPRRYFWDALPADLARAVEAALGELTRLGLVLRDVEIPEWEAAVAASTVLIRCEAAAEYRTVLAERGAELIPQVRERLEAGRATPAPDYVDAVRAGARLTHALGRLFQTVDLLALPGRDSVAPLMDEGGRHSHRISSRNFCAPLNIARVPALTFPCGFSAESLPIGLQLAGRHWDESTLLRVAHAYQQATDWHTRRPPLAA